jgi:signal transduction histidine kinase
LTLLTVIVSALVAASLTRPLNELRQAAHRIGEGEFSATVDDPGSDEIGDLARAFNSMSGKVEAMLEQQRSFASNAAHELRTPLTTMLLRTESLLTGGGQGEQARQYLEEIDTEARRLAGLVDDLLILSRLDAGQLTRGEERVDIGRLARSLLRSYQSQLERKSLTCRLDVADYLPPVTGQMSHLHLVFRNLLDNAIKYTPPGGRITWTVSREGDSLVSRLADTGRGISPEQQQHLFERFYRADTARSRSVPGTGLGLSLTASIVDLYGGQIAVRSPGLDQGTEVTIVWPLSSV